MDCTQHSAWQPRRSKAHFGMRQFSAILPYGKLMPASMEICSKLLTFQIMEGNQFAPWLAQGIREGQTLIMEDDVKQ